MAVVASDIEEFPVGTTGAFRVLFGTDAGLTFDGAQLWHQDVDGLEGEHQTSGFWAESITSGDFNGDGFADVALNQNVVQVNAIKHGRRVHVIYGSVTGLTVDGDIVLNQDTPGIGDAIDVGEGFGERLESGDFNGDAADDLAIGVFDEDSSQATDHGLVHVLYGGPDGITAQDSQVWHQDKAGVESSREEGDLFGMALTAADFNGDGQDELVVGVPGENDARGSGYVLVGSSSGLTTGSDQVWSQNSSGIKNDAEVGDRFAWSMTSGDFDGDGFADLAVAAPWEDMAGNSVASGGLVHVLYGTSNGLRSGGNQTWHQRTLRESARWPRPLIALALCWCDDSSG